MSGVGAPPGASLFPLNTEPRLGSTQHSKNGLDPDFEKFYAAYPRKVGPDDARRAWKAALLKANAAEIVAGLERQQADLRARETRFIPHPSTWLNKGHWKNEAPAPPRGSMQSVAEQAARVSATIQKGLTK